MKRYLLDTNAVGDWINHRHGVGVRFNEAVRRGCVVGTCEVVVAELYHGVENSEKPEKSRILLERALPNLKCWPLTRDASREYGRLVARLVREGCQIGRMDMLIASIALTLPHCFVVSNDKDLLRIPGLIVENWRDLSQHTILPFKPK